MKRQKSGEMSATMRKCVSITEEIGLREVENFWSKNPCNSDLGSSSDRREYFAEIELDRYRNEPHIPEIANFSEHAGAQLLEIGSGVGTDGRRFAEAGASYVGINLDKGSSTLSREAFTLFCLPGNIAQMNAENLAFQSARFDHIYSFGAIHHSPAPPQIICEAARVLKPGGTICVMLYHRNSINYYFEIMFVRKLFRFALLPSFSPLLISKLLGLNRDKLERHRQLFFGRRMTPEEWLSANTDGPDCPLAKVYSKSEAYNLFIDGGFTDIRFRVRFFDPRHYGKIGRCFPRKLVNFVGNRWGWHLIIDARKPTAG